MSAARMRPHETPAYSRNDSRAREREILIRPPHLPDAARLEEHERGGIDVGELASAESVQHTAHFLVMFGNEWQ